MWWFLIGVVVGVALLMLVQGSLLVYWLFFAEEGGANQGFHAQFVPFNLPKELKQLLLTPSQSEVLKKKETCIAWNLVLQFLYQEAKDLKWFRNYVLRKLQIEFNDLLSRTSAGRLIHDLKLRDLSLGHQFPIIKDVHVNNVVLSPDNCCLEEVDLILNIEYRGGFHMSVLAALVLGRNALLSVQLAKMAGAVRFKLSRDPYTHWSICFMQEPVLDFKVDSNFHGRPVPQLVPLIITQFKRALRKRHVFPNYKFRYRPFFQNSLLQPSADHEDFAHIELRGALELTVIKVDRLNLFAAKKQHHDLLYGLISLGPKPSAYGHVPSDYVSILLKLIRRSPEEDLGLEINREFIPERNCKKIGVATVRDRSLASKAGFKPGDLFVAINNVTIIYEKQAEKLLLKVIGELSIVVERRLGDIDDQEAIADRLIAGGSQLPKERWKTELKEDGFLHVDFTNPEDNLQLNPSKNVDNSENQFPIVSIEPSGMGTCPAPVSSRVRSSSESDLSCQQHPLLVEQDLPTTVGSEIVRLSESSQIDCDQRSEGSSAAEEALEFEDKLDSPLRKVQSEAKLNLDGSGIRRRMTSASLGGNRTSGNSSQSDRRSSSGSLSDSHSAILPVEIGSQNRDKVQFHQPGEDQPSEYGDDEEGGSLGGPEGLHGSRRQRLRAKASAVAQKLGNNKRVRQLLHSYAPNSRDDQGVGVDGAGAATEAAKSKLYPPMGAGLTTAGSSELLLEPHENLSESVRARSHSANPDPSLNRVVSCPANSSSLKDPKNLKTDANSLKVNGGARDSINSTNPQAVKPSKNQKANINSSNKLDGASDLGNSTNQQSAGDRLTRSASQSPLIDYDDIIERRTRFIKIDKKAVFEEEHVFCLTPKTKYLNIGIWTDNSTANKAAQQQNPPPNANGGKAEAKKTPGSAETAIQESGLLAYTTLYVPQILSECSSTLSRHHQEKFPLKPPNSTLLSKEASELARHVGFDARLCYGDILLGFRWCPDGYEPKMSRPGFLSSTSAGSPLADEPDDGASLMTAGANINAAGLKFSGGTNGGAANDEVHDWATVSLHGARLCQVCQRKIWLKSALQCVQCMLICHKKCSNVARNVACSEGGVRDLDRNQLNSDSTATAPLPSDPSALMETPSISIPDIEVSEGGSNSGISTANWSELVLNPAAPTEAEQLGQEGLGQNRRFYRGITTKITEFRKRRKGGGPDVGDGGSLGDSDKHSIGGSAINIAGGASDLPAPSGSSGHRKSSKGTASKPEDSDEDLGFHAMLFEEGNATGAYNEHIINAAKDLGKDLLADMQPVERKLKINEQIDKLQHEMNDAARVRVLLLQEIRSTKGQVQAEAKARLKSADDKTEALAVLMLHYCAGLQNCIDLEEEAAELKINNVPNPPIFNDENPFGLGDTNRSGTTDGGSSSDEGLDKFIDLGDDGKASNLLTNTINGDVIERHNHPATTIPDDIPHHNAGNSGSNHTFDNRDEKNDSKSIEQYDYGDKKPRVDSPRNIYNIDSNASSIEDSSDSFPPPLDVIVDNPMYANDVLVNSPGISGKKNAGQNLATK